MQALHDSIWVHASGPATRRMFTYFVCLDAGNVLIHSFQKKSDFNAVADFIEARGGVSYQLLGHSHEIHESCAAVYDRFGATIIMGTADLPPFDAGNKKYFTRPVRKRQQIHNGSIDAIPLPGHTAGFTVYRLTSGKETHLFASDFAVFRAKGTPVPFFEASLAQQGLDSCQELLNIETDYWHPLKGGCDEHASIACDPEYRRELANTLITKTKKKFKC